MAHLPPESATLEGKLPARVRRKLFAHKTAPEGSRVAVRLNLNVKLGDIHIQTVHASGKPTARALGYGIAVTVRDAEFFVNQATRAEIASGRSHKQPMAAVVGNLIHCPPSLEGVPLRFNPKTSHLFVRVDDGRAVRFVEEATIFDTRVYARGGIKYWGADAPEPVEGIETDARG
jgi:hypothetical protein